MTNATASESNADRKSPPPGFTVHVYNECWFYWTSEIDGKFDEESDSFERAEDAIADAWLEFDTRNAAA